MKTFMLLFALFTGFSAFTQETETSVIARMGMRNSATYHYSEVYQTRGRWIYPDVLYIDFAHNNYREIGIGGGAVLYASKRFIAIEEGYIEQATGTASGNATYFIPWTLVIWKITPKVASETCYFPYLPLNKSGRIQHVLERSKVEYEFKRWKLGGGYGAYQFGEDKWEHKPFASVTLKGGKYGDLEFWLQRMPQGAPQVQIRYAMAFKTRRNHQK
jgi:hypothetical protein